VGRRSPHTKEVGSKLEPSLVSIRPILHRNLSKKMRTLTTLSIESFRRAMTEVDNILKGEKYWGVGRGGKVEKSSY
jgi:hypothetical protein